MSGVKNYLDDAWEVQDSAGLAALHDDPHDRAVAMARTFVLCVTLASEYHDPRTATLALVTRAADAFRIVRLGQRVGAAA